VDQSQPVTSMMRDADVGKSGQGWSRWMTWRGLGLLAAAIVLPFGWVLPLVQLARERASTRRRTNFYSN
jgi:hypothetical protein